MKSFLWFSLLLQAMASASSAQTTSKPRVSTVKAPAVSAREVQHLRDALAAQQQQMEQQRQQMEQLKSQLQQLLNANQQASASAQKVESTAEQAQSSAAQAEQSATEAQRLADQASANAAETKTQLSLVSAKTQDEDKKLSALQMSWAASGLRVTFVSAVRTLPSRVFRIATVPACAFASEWKES